MENAQGARELHDQDEIDRLRTEHGQLEKRLAELDGHLSLTPGEQIERARLKKWKLRIKDRLTALGG